MLDENISHLYLPEIKANLPIEFMNLYLHDRRHPLTKALIPLVRKNIRATIIAEAIG